MLSFLLPGNWAVIEIIQSNEDGGESFAAGRSSNARTPDVMKRPKAPTMHLRGTLALSSVYAVGSGIALTSPLPQERGSSLAALGHVTDR